MPSVVTFTASLYTPGATSTRSPGFALFTAPWIVGASSGTLIVRPLALIVGAVCSPEPVGCTASGAGPSPTPSAAR